MSDIVVRRTHSYDMRQARAGAEKIAAQLAEEFGLHYAWDGDVLQFKRTGVTGELQVGAREVEIRVRLGFLLSALKPRIEQEIHRVFDEKFGKGDGTLV